MYKAYKIIKQEELPDIYSKGTLLRHNKTGAHVILLQNEDDNKVFNIAFRTPPADSTGVAHIIEHTVLCGSEKYPLKDPFVELAKGSLNTFLNAMTFPDKTMYPVASCNDVDFKNLMSVYRDAVFFPNIYNTKKIFEQEGWHYHIKQKDEPISYNGVVYNEMKGVYSSVDSVLESTVMSNLFPDSIYGKESGGDPEYIPNLSYEQYLDFHRTYYHPSNSYIALYGNMDMEERLDWIDREYLSRFDKKEVNSEIKIQKGFSSPKSVSGYFPVLDDEPIEGNTCLNMSFVVGDSRDVLNASAFTILAYALLNAPGAPLKKALIDAGVGKDISGGYEDGLLQHIFSIDIKYAEAEDKEKFEKVVRDTLQKLADDGLDEKALRAAIHYYEFRFREADFSTCPKGLIYIMSAFESWLYDEDNPFEYLKELSIFDELKKRIGTGYYEKLIREKLLENSFRLVTVLQPKRGLIEEKEEQRAKKLKEFKESLSEEELTALIDETYALEAYQQRVDDPETLASLPRLTKADIEKEPKLKFCTKEEDICGLKILHHDYETRGISYLTLLFDIADISNELIPYVKLLSSILGLIDTKNYGYAQLSNEINARTGGIDFGLTYYTDEQGACREFLCVKAKYMDRECAFVFDMLREIIFSSKPDDEKRLRELLMSKKAYYQDSIPAAGHMSAVSKASAGLSRHDDRAERTSGVAYYRFIEGLCADFELKKADLIARFKDMAAHIFRSGNLIVSVNGSKEGYEAVKSRIPEFVSELNPIEKTFKSEDFVPYESSSAVVTSGSVQFVARAGNFREAGCSYTGALLVLRTILNYDYLWKRLREKGGAYGCMSMFRRSGNMYVVSYRDPHLKNTLDVYDAMADFIGSFEADEETMDKLIIGTISGLDTPLNARAEGEAALSAYFSGLDESKLRKERDEVLGASASDIRALKTHIKLGFEKKHMCVLGSDSAIKKHEGLFEHIEAFIQA